MYELEFLNSDESIDINSCTLIHKDSDVIKLLVNIELLKFKEKEEILEAQSRQEAVFSISWRVGESDFKRIKINQLIVVFKDYPFGQALTDKQWIIECDIKDNDEEEV